MARTSFNPDGNPVTPFAAEDVPNDAHGLKMLGVTLYDASGNPVTSFGGGGGAATIADGADVAQGTTTDAATANTVIGRLKKIVSLLPAALGQTTAAGSVSVVGASDWRAKQTAIGAATVPTDAVVSVANTSTTIVAANASRSSVLIRNVGAQTVYLFCNGAATTSKLPLNAGEAITFRHQLAVTGIVASGTCNVYVVEEQW